MQKRPYLILVLIIFSMLLRLSAQTTSTSSNNVAQPVQDRTVLFEYSGIGVSKPMIWGMDAGGWTTPLIWTTGINYLGAQNIKITRIPVFPTDILLGDTLQQNQKKLIRERLSHVALVGHPVQVMLNHGGGEISWYSRDAVGHARYALLMELTKKYIESFGHTVVSITGYNEPDYGWDGATMDDFKNFIAACKLRPGLSGVRYCGGNTLNNDLALNWYNYIKPAGLTEGNTHQLAGGFDSYATFYQTVKANGDYATNDEVHDIMEGIVGAEYGLQAGIYWGYANLARGEFVKACNGVRLGYAEHRPNWTAAAVYRKTDGQVQAFCGASERQATTTTYRYVSKDKDVFYEGYGPQREYTLIMPGGTGYQVNQPYAERVINISTGDDVQQPINGSYVIVNKMSSKAIEVLAGSTGNGAAICQRTYKTATNQQWNVTPVNTRVGGDFSYFTFSNVNSAKVFDLLNYSLDNGGKIIQWDNLNGGNQQWYLEYIADGWFYIRNRHSSKYLEVGPPYVLDGASIQQGVKTGSANQQWRFVSVGSPVEFVAPTAPTNLVSSSNATSVRLDWTANTESDLSGYTVFRSDSATGAYNTIARNVKTTSFVDNSTAEGKQYFYRIKAVDKSLNRSAYSNQTTARVTGDNDMVAHYKFELNTLDSTENLNHSATYGSISYIDGKFGTKGISLNGTDAFVQLPATVANYTEMTISAWVFLRGTTSWQRIFDFGNDLNQYMYLTPRSNAAMLRFAIKNGSAEQSMNATALPFFTWSHVAVTLSATGARMFVNGVQVAESGAITINPSDFKPVLNYIGRSQYADPLFNGIIEDFRIYNYALSATEVAQVASTISGIEEITAGKGELSLWPIPATQSLHINYVSSNVHPSQLSLLDLNGKLIMQKQIECNIETEINVSEVPTGIYVLQLTNNYETMIKKIIISHE